MKVVNIRISQDLLDKIEAMAAKESRSRSNMIQLLLRKALGL